MTTSFPTIKTMLPDGYTARPVTMDDLQATVDLINTYTRSTTGTDDITLETLEHDWQTSTFQLATDSIGVFTPDQQMVAYGEFWDNGPPHVRYYTYGVVHPDFQGQGVGSFLVEWLMEHGQQNTAKAPADARVEVQQSFLPHGDNEELFSAYGFQHIRSFYRMLINFDASPQEPAQLDGINIRPINGDEEMREAIRAVYDSFRDHWGVVDEPFDDFLKRWLERVTTDHKFDPSLWFIALKGQEIAGISLCWDSLDEDPQMGWVGTLGVRRPWRKHGLGLALLQHSFCEFYKRGKPRVGLGVDASSLTGATRLYERAGMHAARTYHVYALELRPGKDYTTQTLHE